MNENITELIYNDNDITEITSLQSNLYDEIIGFDEYLTKALAKLQGLLKEKYKDIYVFGKLYYRDNYENFHLKEFYNDPSNAENQIFHNGIKVAEKLVLDKSQTSLSVVLIDGFLRGILLHKGSEVPKEIIPGIITNNYNDDPNGKFGTLPNIPVDKINEILTIHKGMANDCVNSPELYSYLLRTRNFDKDYNGALFIVLKGWLPIAEYSRIVDLFTHIMHAKIKFDYKRDVWRKVIEYRSHALHHQHFAEEGIKRNLRDAFDNKDAAKFDENMRRLDAIDNYTKDFDDMAYALQKVQFKKANYDILEANDKVKSLLNPKKLEVRKTIIECIEMIRLSIDLIRFEGEEKHKEKIRGKILSKLTNQVKKNFGPLNIRVVPEMFKVVIQDILKNAVKFTDKENPQLEIWLDDLNITEVPESIQTQLDITSEYFVIAFKNNKSIDKKTFDFLSHGKITDDLPLEKRVSLGVNTIHRLTGYNGIGVTASRWFFTPSNECLRTDKYTKVLLIIPKSDIT